MTFDEFLAGKGITPGDFDALSDEEKEALRAEFNGAGGGTAEAGIETEEGGTGEGDGEGAEAVEVAAAEAAAEAAADEIETAVEAGEITPEEGDQIFEDVAGDTAKELEAAEGCGDDDKEVKAAARKIAAKKVKARVFRARIKAKKNSTVEEARRQNAIKAFCASLGRKGAEYAGRAIAEGWSYDKTERVVRANMKTETKLNGLSRSVPGGGSTANGAPRKQDVMTAAFALTCKLRPEYVQKHFGFSENVMNAAMAKENRNVTLRRLIFDSVNSLKPGYANAGSNSMEVVDAMHQLCRRHKESQLDRNLNASIGFSTISATDVLHAIIEAYLLDQPTAAAPFYKTITKERSFTNFNQVDSYLPTLIGQLSKISETGQIEHVGYTTQKISAKTEPLGATFAIPEMVLINDQLDVFVELLQQFRDLPEKCVEHDVAQLFWRMIDGDVNAEDGSAFFSTGRGNVLTGAGTALSEAGLNAATEALDSMTNDNGEPITTEGAFIVTSSALFATAQRLYVSENLNVVDTIGEKNVYQGVYKPYKWAYLNSGLARTKKDDGSTNSDLQTYKASQWYVFRDPQRRPIMQVNKLVGYESPQVKQFDSDPSTWGTVYQLIYPYSISPAFTDGALVMRGA